MFSKSATDLGKLAPFSRTAFRIFPNINFVVACANITRFTLSAVISSSSHNLATSFSLVCLFPMDVGSVNSFSVSLVQIFSNCFELRPILLNPELTSEATFVPSSSAFENIWTSSRRVNVSGGSSILLLLFTPKNPLTVSNILKFWGEEVELKLLLSFPLLLFIEDNEEGRNFCRCFLIIINVFIIVSLTLSLSSSSVAKRSYYPP